MRDGNLTAPGKDFCYNQRMRFLTGRQRRKANRQGFSLIELSIVIVIMSIVSVLGLEVAVQFLGNRAYTETQLKLAALDQAMTQFYRVNGRLPCPANRTIAPLDLNNGINYGQEDCGTLLPGTETLTLPKTGPVLAGSLPFRALNLPVSASLDSYGDRINYFVTQGMTDSFSFPTVLAAIEIRTGILQQPCSTNCELVADPTPTVNSGAAYVLFSNGPDKRGGRTKNGGDTGPCVLVNDTRIDGQNCVNVAGAGLGSVSPGAIPANVLYDSRYNPGTQTARYFDDILVWRSKGQL